MLTLRFKHGMTQRQIAERIGVSQMQVSRILRRITNGLRGTLDIDCEAPSTKRRRNGRRKRSH